MNLMIDRIDISDYLSMSDIIDGNHPDVKQQAASLVQSLHDDVDRAKTIYEYVRDKIPHSADIGAVEVACSASDVLRYGHGICYAKSHLLAAMLRSVGIPCGFCYQNIFLTDESSPLIVHALNAVYLERLDRWVRVDARGNNPGINAQFSLDEERLAFPVRQSLGESDGLIVYAEPSSACVAVLRKYTNTQELMANLPRTI